MPKRDSSCPQVGGESLGNARPPGCELPGNVSRCPQFTVAAEANGSSQTSGNVRLPVSGSSARFPPARSPRLTRTSASQPYL